MPQMINLYYIDADGNKAHVSVEKTKRTFDKYQETINARGIIYYNKKLYVAFENKQKIIKIELLQNWQLRPSTKLNNKNWQFKIPSIFNVILYKNTEYLVSFSYSNIKWYAQNNLTILEYFDTREKAMKYVEQLNNAGK